MVTTRTLVLFDVFDKTNPYSEDQIRDDVAHLVKELRIEQRK